LDVAILGQGTDQWCFVVRGVVWTFLKNSKGRQQMKFKKRARDRTQAVLNEGDIIQVDGDTVAVIRKIVHFGRDQFPDLQVTEIKTDFLGKLVKMQRATYNVEQYHTYRCLDPNMLRDDAAKFAKAKELRQKILSEKPNRFK